MVEVACHSDPRFVVSRLEEGDRKSYSIDTIERVKAEGGYLLARVPDSITVGEVLRAVESMKGSNRGLREDPFCAIWQRVDEAVSDVLDHTSFGELAREWQARNARYVPNWEI